MERKKACLRAMADFKAQRSGDEGDAAVPERGQVRMLGGCPLR